MNKKVDIYTDGACSGNPGPGGWGVLIELDNKNIELSGGDKETTNNRMELMAAIKALEEINKDYEINLYTDSNYVKDGITSWISNWKKNNWKTANKKDVKNKELWMRLDEAIKDRMSKNISSETIFVGINSAEIKDHEQNKNILEVTVEFISEITSCMRDKDNRVISGDPDKVKKVHDTWKFSKDSRSSNPNWFLVDTQV